MPVTPLRIKIPYGIAFCTVCCEPDLSTDGYKVVCRCGETTKPKQWGITLRCFARQVRRVLKRRTTQGIDPPK